MRFDSTGQCPNGVAASYVTQWWNNVLSQSSATAVPVTSGVVSGFMNVAMAVTPVAPPPPSGSSSSGSGTSLSSTGTATAANEGTTATAAGGGALTVSQYVSNPVSSPSFSSTGEFLDVALSKGNSFTSVVIDDCNLNGGTSLQWWNPQGNSGAGAWQAVVPSPTYSAGPPACLSVTLTSSTSPSLSQLTGTVFAVASSCAAGLNAHVLSATYAKGTFTGLFCVNAKGVGTYTQGTVSGIGAVTVVKGTTVIGALGKNLALGGVDERHQEWVRRAGSAPGNRDVQVELTRGSSTVRQALGYGRGPVR